MDVVSAASDLRQLLVAHDISYRQMSAVDEYIVSTSQRRFMSSIEGNQSQTLHLAMRQSVGEGIQTMYTQYQQRKWHQIQEKASSIISTLHEGDQQQSPSPQQPGGSTSTDKAAGLWSSTFCEFYRDS